MSVGSSSASSSAPLNARATPFTFNPNAKAFFVPKASVQTPVVKPRLTYTAGEIFSLQQPLYSGSNLVINPDVPDLSDIFLYDPCFDYLSAGLITAVPIDQISDQMQINNEEDGVTNEDEQIQHGQYTPSDSSSRVKVSPARSKRNHSASDAPNPAAIDMIHVDSPSGDVSTVVAPADDSDPNSDLSCSSGDDPVDSIDSSSGGGGTPFPFLDDHGLTYQSSQKYYYFTNPTPIDTYTHATPAQHADTSFHADRRRQKQSAYLSNFPSHSNNAHYSRSRFDYRSGSSYSPPLLAHRRDFYFQQDLHLHLHSSTPKIVNLQSYTRDKLLELRLKDSCREKPENLPMALQDIYKPEPQPNRVGRNGEEHDEEENEPTSKRGGKGKSKRKKNKDRTARELDEPDRSVVDSSLKRNRADSVDADDDGGDRPGPTIHHTMHTPKVRPAKGKKGQSTAKKIGGKGRHGHDGHTFTGESSEFDNATLDDLHHAQHAWTRASQMEKAGQDTMVQIEKAVRSILNKLSIDKLPLLAESILALPIDSHHLLQCVVDIIFDKSVDEPAFAKLYASFCALIAPDMAEFDVEEENGCVSHSFRTMLLTKCYTLLVEDEAAFMQSTAQQSATPLTPMELEEKLHVFKCHQKGNLIFIAELYKQSLLRSSVVHLCLDMLLDDILSPAEWDVECVCVFLGAAGEKLDHFDPEDEEYKHMETFKPDEMRTTRRNLVDAHFNKISQLARNPSLPSRFRFMLLDLLDLRARGWVPRITKTVDPKSLHEIRHEAAVAGIATPAGKFSNGHHHHGGAMMTTGGKRFATKNNNANHQAIRTAAKPSGKSSAASSFEGRTLQFGSPMFQRSSSAPDHRDTESLSNAFEPLDPHTESDDHASASLSAGKYLPVWKRRQLGVELGKVLPRTLQPALTEQPNITEEEEEDPTQQEHEPHANEDDQALATTDATMPVDDMLRGLDGLLDELIESHDVDEAILCFTEIAGQCAPDAASIALLMPLLSKSTSQPSTLPRRLCVDLIHRLIESSPSRMRPELMEAGMREFIYLLPDLTIDVPHAVTYTNELFAPLIASGALTLPRLLSLYTDGIGEEVLTASDARAWTIALIAQLKHQLDDDQQKLRDILKCELPTFLEPNDMQLPTSTN